MVLHPTEEIIEITKSFQEIISQFADVIDSHSQFAKSKAYKSDVAIADYIRLLMRNVEGVLCLANTNILLLPPALVISRSIFELWINLIWLMEPDDSIERENRLLSILKKDKDERGKYIRNLSVLDVNQSDIDILENDKQEIQKYYDEIKNRLSSRYIQVEYESKFEHLCKNLKLEKHYPLYRILSNSVHARHSSTWTLMHDEAKDWNTPLSVCWVAFGECSSRFSHIFNYDLNSFLSTSTIGKFDLLFEKLKQSS